MFLILRLGPAVVELHANERARGADPVRQRADDPDGLRRRRDTGRDGPLTNRDLVRSPSNRLQAHGVHPHQRQVLLLVRADQLGIHLFFSGEPAGQFAFLEFAGFGECQPVGVHHGGERNGGSVHVQLDDGIAGCFGHRGKGAQRGLPAAIVCAGAMEKPRHPARREAGAAIPCQRENQKRAAGDDGVSVMGRSVVDPLGLHLNLQREQLIAALDLEIQRVARFGLATQRQKEA